MVGEGQMNIALNPKATSLARVGGDPSSPKDWALAGLGSIAYALRASATNKSS